MGKRHAVTAVGAAAFLMLVAAPVVVFVSRVVSLSVPGELWGSVSRVLSSRSTWRTVGFTASQAALSALFAVVAGLPGAYLISRVRIPLRRLVSGLMLIPFILPSIIVVICMVSFWGRNGLVSRLTGSDSNLIYSFAGIVVAHLFYNLALAIRVVGDGFASIDTRYLESASSLGDGRAGAFFRVTLPLLLPSLVTAFLLVFLYCFLSFGVVLVFGGARWATLEVRIYQEMYVRLDMGSALTYALLELLLCLGFMLLANRFIGRVSVSGSRGRRSATRRFSDLSPAGRAAAATYGVLLLVFLLGPILTMAGRALSPRGVPSLESFRALFTPTALGRDVSGILRSNIPQVIGTSVLLASGAGSVAFVAALAAALAMRRRTAGIYDALFQLPMGLSVVTLAIGVDLAAGSPSTSRAVRPLLVLAVQAIVAFPVVYRIARTAVASLEQGYVDSARSLGAGAWARLRDVELPILRRGLLNAYAYGLAIAFADFTAVMAVGRGDVVTFPVAIYRLIGFRSFDLALALGVIYVMLCALLFAAVDATSAPRQGGR